MRKAMLVLAVLGLAGSLWAADPSLGTWKLNVAQSKFSGPAPKEATLVYKAVGDEIEVAVAGTEANGSPISYKYTRPQAGGATKWVGPPPAFATASNTAIVTVISPSESYLTILKDGKQVEAVHEVISKDAKSMQLLVKGKDSQGKPFETIEVFDKQ
jgi:hypothetical protein